MISPGPHPNRLYRILKLVFGPALRVLYRVKVEGLEHVPMRGPLIVACNHVSFVDSMFVALALPRQVVFVGLASFFKNWKTGWILRGLGMIPVEPGYRGEAALEAGLQVLREGGALGLYPEGTRSPDGRLYRGHTGVARLALRSKAPVLPVGVLGAREVMRKGARFPRLWGRVTLRCGEPLELDGRHEGPETRFILRSVTDEVMYEIMSLTGQTYTPEYATSVAEPEEEEK